MTGLQSKTYHSRAHNEFTGLELMADKPNKEEKWPSYTMVDPRMRKIYFQFYQETYKSTVLDRKTKELIAIATERLQRINEAYDRIIKAQAA